VVCNFSLVGKDIVSDVLRAMPEILGVSEHGIIQTLHPAYAGEPYCDGWREASWAGFCSDFVELPPWYIRTPWACLALFSVSSLDLKELIDPSNTDARKPISMIFVLSGSQKGKDFTTI
jgi:hypothetical protein